MTVQLYWPRLAPDGVHDGVGRDAALAERHDDRVVLEREVRVVDLGAAHDGPVAVEVARRRALELGVGRVWRKLLT